MANVPQQHVKDKFAPYKYWRWIEFLNALPKTAPGSRQTAILAARGIEG